MIPFLDADAIRGSVSMVELLDAVESAYRDVAAGRDRSPIRSRLPLGEGDLLLMPGLRDGGDGATVKIVTVMPSNAARGLPTVQATVVWLDGTTGQPRAILDGETLTAMRTGAASGVGTRLLAQPDASSLAVLGAGRQAEWQVHAVLAARPIRRVAVYARSPDARATFAARMVEATGLRVEAVDSAEAAVEGADVICCATTSSEPVFDASSLRSGTHVNGIGAYRLGMIEIPPGAFGQASLVAVDSLAAAREEAGDVMAAVEAGSVAEGSLVEIGSVGRDWAKSRDADAITIFKSVGLAIQDVAAAELVVARLLGDRP